MSFPNVIYGSEEEALTGAYATERVPVGSQMITPDGRTFRFCEAGVGALVVANMEQSIVPLDNNWEEVVDTLAAGVTVLTGVGSTANLVALDALKEGYAWFPTAADLNPAYRIKSNAAIASGGTGNVTLYSPLVAAVAAATTISYLRNPWRKIIQTPGTTPTAFVCGTAVRALALDTFGWLATRGPVRVLTQGTLVIGDPCGAGTDAGSVGPLAAAGPVAELNTIYGKVLVVQPTTLMSLIYLEID
jgi:hypothetical protein